MTDTGSREDPCFACRSGFHHECHSYWIDDSIECCCGGEVVFTATGEVKGSNEGLSETTSFDKEHDTGYIEDGYVGGKDLSQYKDPVSTGRKRAAEMYPIESGMVCEWANLGSAGGGVVPIIGCLGRPASDRHHGPDKNTMNNAPGNLHRICDYCHNTWHALNDPHYGDRPDHTRPFVPKGEKGIDWFDHDNKVKASIEQVLEAEKRRMENT